VALVIGLVQGLAIIPGISRSGSTIAAGLLLGMDRETAGSYSFLLSVPAICGAALLHLVTGGGAGFNLQPVLAGTAVSFVVGFLALKMLMFIVRQGRLYLFAPYCLLAGLLVLLFGA
jgi:undecaprenyl-diphosphatase